MINSNYHCSSAMVKGSMIVEAPSFPFNYADMKVRLLVINQVDSGRTGPPYDVDVYVKGLNKEVTLLAAMEAARDDGKFSLV